MNQGLLAWTKAGSVLFGGGQMVQLGADVTLTPVNTYVDVLTLTLNTGTWLVMASACMVKSGSASDFEAKLWDGTNVFASGEGHSLFSGNAQTVPLVAIITLQYQTTIKLTCASANVTTVLVKAATPINGSGNNATTLLAVRLV